MGNISIENEYSLQEAFNSGINLFVGAGFSIYAHDFNDRSLPLGSQLAEELCNHFNKNLHDLPKLATILEATRKDDFHKYLTNRFSVKSYPKFYNILNDINVKSIFTTNIDNLIPKIINESRKRYIHYQNVNGESTDVKAINYLPLHGNVEQKHQEYIFGIPSLANIFDNSERTWWFLTHAIEKYPTLFIGYGLNDSSTIQALTSKKTFNNAQKEKWIVLKDYSTEEKEYYESLGFSIIISDTKQFLEYIGDKINSKNIPSQQSSNCSPSIKYLFPKNIVPHTIKNISKRPIKEFFQGLPPTWTDIFSNIIYKTSHFLAIKNSVYDLSKHTIIIGAPVTGKTTLAMQIAHEITYDGTKLIFDHLTTFQADFLIHILNKEKALIFVENFTDNIEAFIKLSSIPNVKLIGIDRSHNFGMVNHLFDQNYTIINVTELTERDTQKIFESLPSDIRNDDIKKEKNTKYSDDSIFEFVIRNIKGQNIKERYTHVLKQLEKDHQQLAEFLVLCAYMHSSRVPLSMEVSYSYFNDRYNYKEVLKMKNELGDLLKEYHTNELIDDYEYTDYYYPRSYYIAESILKNASGNLLKKIMNKIISDVPKIQIYNYNTFRKHAFDKNIVLNAFFDWKEGKEFYERAYLYDDENPYILQQGALYLSAKQKHLDAFGWIEKAITKSRKNLSIKNSHAIILFNANYDSESTSAEEQLDYSMEILHNCYSSDQRKSFHAITYADQAIRYFNRIYNEKTLKYLNQAKIWLDEEMIENKWNTKIKEKLKQIRNILNKL